jgi:DNA/RNA-binding protein KIN17
MSHIEVILCLISLKEFLGIKLTCKFSEGHLRQMKLFAEKPGSVISGYSYEFEKGFLETLSHRHGSKRGFKIISLIELFQTQHNQPFLLFDDSFSK